MPFRNQNDDLFEESRMSFGEHLEELRHVLIRSLIGVAIGCVLGFLVAERVVNILQTPLESALTKFYVKDGKQRLRNENGYLAPELSKWLDEERMVPETFLVDPGQLVGGLRSISPDFLKNVTLRPYRFSVNQFSDENVLAVCKNWTEMKSGDDSQLSQWKLLWGLVTENDRLKLTGIAGQNALNDGDKQAFIEVLNRLLAEPEISNSKEFAPLIQQTSSSLADVLEEKKDNALLEMKERLTEKFDPDLSERLNRLLISDSFGQDVKDVQLEMIPLTVWKSARYKSQSLGATEPFMIWVKASVATGLLISSPWVFFQIWSFVAAGLYPAEQKYVYFFLPVSLGLFLAGALLAFFFVFEPVLDFLFSFNARMGISPQPRINDWLSFVMFLPLGFGVAFQLPLVMLFANRIELITVEAYTSNWRIAIVAIFGLSMLLTPADPISMIMLAIPLTGLYFLGIILCKRLNKTSNPYTATAAS